MWQGGERRRTLSALIRQIHLQFVSEDPHQVGSNFSAKVYYVGILSVCRMKKLNYKTEVLISDVMTEVLEISSYRSLPLDSWSYILTWTIRL